MCKILCITSHDPAQRNTIIQKAWLGMYGTPDGYGAAWFGADGSIGFFKRSHPRIYGYDGPKGEPPSYVVKKGTYQRPSKAFFSESNDIPSDGGFLIIHGRNATGLVNVANTHPMVRPDAAMVHNGVVQSLKYNNELDGCTCDSELLLNAFMAGGVAEIEKEISGYYAFMCLSHDAHNDQMVKTLHVAKDRRALLVCGIRPDGSYAFATVESMLKDVDAEFMGDVEDCSVITFRGPTECESVSFKPNPFTFTEQMKALADKAMGRETVDPDTLNEDHWTEEYYGRHMHHQGAHTPLPQHTPPLPTTTLEADMREIERLEHAAIDERIFEVEKA